MAIHRLNHAVLYVRDVERTREFYENALGFQTLMYAPGQAAFFRAPGSTNDHDLGTFQIGSGAGASEAGRRTVGLYHLAWEVDTLGDLAKLAQVLAERGALVGASDHVTTKSLYAVVPASHLTDALREEQRKVMTRALDLRAEIERFGVDTRGGIGVSIPG